MPDASDRAPTGPALNAGLADDPRHFCRLFADMINEGLCSLRRRELNIEGVLSCRGCNKDVLRESPAGLSRLAG